MVLKSGIPLLLFLISLQASPGNVTPWEKAASDLAGLRDVRYRHYLQTSRSVSYSGRTKRSALFSTGVKVCPQETAKAVITSHRAYYRLRVCQEAIWEAFRIFFDRVPNSEEYMSWVYTCQHENLCLDDLALNFSSSPEHLDLVARRVADLGDSEGAMAETPAPGIDCTWTLQSIIPTEPAIDPTEPAIDPTEPAIDPTEPAIIPTEPAIIPTEPSMMFEEPNLIPENPLQYIVEFSVTIEDPVYSELLRDPATPEYADAVRELRDKMYQVFASIPGFKDIQVLGFRAEDMSVRYAVLFNGDTELGDQPEGFHTTDVETQRDMNVPNLQNIIMRALKQEHSLPLDLNGLNFDAVYAVDDHKKTHTMAFPVEGSSTNAMSASTYFEDFNMSTVMPFIPDDLTMVNWVEPEATPAHPAREAVTHVELLPSIEEIHDSQTTESAAVIHLFSDDSPTQIPEMQVTVPTSLESTDSHAKKVDTTVDTSAAADIRASGQSSEETVHTVQEEEAVLPVVEEPVHPINEAVLPVVEEPVHPINEAVLPVVEEAVLPVKEVMLPVEETVLPVEETVLPVEETVLPVEETVLPVEETVLPVEEAVLPVEEAVLPVEETVLPVEEVALPVEEVIVPQVEEEAVAPAEEEVAVPVEEVVLPVEEEAVSEVEKKAVLKVEEDTVLPVGEIVVPDKGEAVPEVEKEAVHKVEETVLPGEDRTVTTPASVTSDLETISSESGATFTEEELSVSPTEEGSGSGLSAEADTGLYWTRAPAMRQASTPMMAAVERSKDLVVFFRLRVSNMMFTDSLFNKDSAEYKTLENTFLELLLPYLATNLTGFKALEILSFQNGSVIVNSKMKLNKAVPYNVTDAVQCVLEDFCSSATSQLDIQVDSRSLEVEPADEPDPCQSITCSEFSRCIINGWSGEAECMCDLGYRAEGEGQTCQSLCTLEPDFCLNGGLCENIPGHGATCRCPVGKYWHYHGERCDELITLPLDTSFIITALVGSLCLVAAVISILIFINKKCIRPQKAVTTVQTPFAFDHALRVNPAFQNDDELITQTSTLPYPPSSSQSQASEQEHFASIENIHLSIEIPRQLYTTRSEKLMSNMVDFHHCIPHSQTWLPQSPGKTCCVLRASENDCLEVTVV
uniref:Interphotoreceptor matrix proteoglycan 1 n=1 Tax=Knipowitschia caucasica TaxID=637954 RepID=A0AAV2JFY0_KNICA